MCVEAMLSRGNLDVNPLRTACCLKETIGRDAAMQWLLARTALLHPTGSSGVYLPHRVGMMHECSTAESLTRAVFMYHDDKEHSA